MNKRPAIRIDDPGIHTACCGTNTWKAQRGSATVFINGKAAIRRGDPTQHCGGIGQMIEGSSNVIIGENTSSGAAAGASSSRGASAGGGAAARRGASADERSGASGTGSSGASAGGHEAAVNTAGSEPRTGAPSEQPDREQVYVINTRLTAPGGVPLGGEQVVLLRAGTDEQIAGPFTTDAEGGFAAIVPEDVPYDVQLLDTGHRGDARTTDDGDVQAHLHLGFFENGVPAGGEAVTITRPDGSTFAAVLDADGMLDLVADHGEHQIAIRDETFHAHTLTSADLASGGSHYEFALPPPQHDFETARANRYHPDHDDEGAG